MTAITLLNESGSELAQTDLSLRLIGADRLKQKSISEWLSASLRIGW